jgi:hypothetical protein
LNGGARKKFGNHWLKHSNQIETKEGDNGTEHLNQPEIEEGDN